MNVNQPLTPQHSRLISTSISASGEVRSTQEEREEQSEEKLEEEKVEQEDERKKTRGRGRRGEEEVTDCSQSKLSIA